MTCREQGTDDIGPTRSIGPGAVRQHHTYIVRVHRQPLGESYSEAGNLFCRRREVMTGSRNLSRVIMMVMAKLEIDHAALPGNLDRRYSGSGLPQFGGDARRCPRRLAGRWGGPAELVAASAARACADTRAHANAVIAG